MIGFCTALQAIILWAQQRCTPRRGTRRLVIRTRSRPRGLIALEHGYEPITAAMTTEQLDQIAKTVRDNLLNHLDREVDNAMCQLDITDEISDDEWQSLVDLILG